MISKLKQDRKEQIYQTKKQELINKDKEDCLKKALGSIDIYKKTHKRLRKENDDSTK